jgi:hypothetical protein
MFEAIASPYLVSDDGTFRVKDAATAPPEGSAGKKKNKQRLAKRIDEISDLQRILYAHDKHAILLIFQAMDAAGKDSTIRAWIMTFYGEQQNACPNGVALEFLTAVIMKRCSWCACTLNISWGKNFPIAST